MLSEAEGAAAVRLARWAAGRDGAPSERHGPAPQTPSALFAEPRGVFVTLRHHPAGDLRGCIGFSRPVYPLRRAIPEVAWAAGHEDPRFPPLDPGELDRLTVEVSILTVPERLPPRERRRFPELVVVGRDGLIVEGFGASGLLLPQVAGEQGWDAAELLGGTCEKAGLPTDAWASPEVAVYRFAAEVAREERPGGPVVTQAWTAAPTGPA